jgi:hypothetical protein
LRATAWTAAALVVVLGVLPLVLDRDSYPLSTYPMFARDRPRENAVTTAVLVVDGGVRRLDPELIAATDEVILAVATVVDAVDRGTAGALCAEIAGRVRSSGRLADGSAPAAVEVVTEWYDAVAYFASDRRPMRRVVHERCAV